MKRSTPPSPTSVFVSVVGMTSAVALTLSMTTLAAFASAASLDVGIEAAEVGGEVIDRIANSDESLIYVAPETSMGKENDVTPGDNVTAEDAVTSVSDVDTVSLPHHALETSVQFQILMME